MRLLLFFFFSICYGQKILVFSPKFGISHMRYMGGIADILHNNGYNVTVLQPIVSVHHTGTGCHHAPVLQVEADEKTAEAGAKAITEDFWETIWTADLYNPRPVLDWVPVLGHMFDLSCRNLMNKTDLIEQLRREKYDLAITELFDFCGVVLFHELKLKNIIGTTSFLLQEGTSMAIGSPVIPSYVPGSQSVANDDGSLLSRITNLVFSYSSHKFQNDHQKVAQQIMDELYPEADQIWETVGNMPFILTNSHPLIDFPKPTLHKIVDLGGIGVGPGRKISKDLDEILSLRKTTVLVSFGSVAPTFTMPVEMKKALMRAFASISNVTFLWKYETPEDGVLDVAPNVFLVPWTPQCDLLADGRISLFVTHGGAGSRFEAAARGVPIMLVPLFAEQMRNARIAERMGFGTIFPKQQLFDDRSVEEAIRKALQNTSLSERAHDVSRMLALKTYDPETALLKTVRLALDFPWIGQILAPNGRNFSIVQYYNIDIILFLLIVVYFVLRKSLGFTFFRFSAKDEKVKTQ